MGANLPTPATKPLSQGQSWTVFSRCDGTTVLPSVTQCCSVREEFPSQGKMMKRASQFVTGYPVPWE